MNLIQTCKFNFGYNNVQVQGKEMYRTESYFLFIFPIKFCRCGNIIWMCHRLPARFECTNPFSFFFFSYAGTYFLLHGFFPKFKVSSLCIYINIFILSLYVYFPFLKCRWMIFAHYFLVVMLPMVAYLRIDKVSIINL